MQMASIEKLNGLLDAQDELIEKHKVLIEKLTESLDKKQSECDALLQMRKEQNSTMEKMEAVMNRLAKMAGVNWRSMMN